jgi:hypothetical protein
MTKTLKTKIDIVIFISTILQYKDDKEKLSLLVKEYKSGLYEVV